MAELTQQADVAKQANIACRVPRGTCDHHERDNNGSDHEARTPGSGEQAQQQGEEEHHIRESTERQSQPQHMERRESEAVLPHQTDSWQQADRWQQADGWEEVVLLLDLLSLSPCLYAPPLRAMLRAPHTLKLGFAFSDDLEFLHQSLPSYHHSLSSHHHSLPPHHHSLPSHQQSLLPDQLDCRPAEHEHPSHDCFHHVAPFIDVGTAYHAIRRTRLHLKRDNLLSLLTATAPPGSLASKSVLPPASGLSALAQVLLGAPLDKELQCSDWEQRPLSRHQLHYAAADALCLIHMALALLPLALRPHALSARALSPHALSPHALSAHALSANGKVRQTDMHGKALVPPWDVSRGGDGHARFLCDSMVEGLARQLRCVGVDTASPKTLGRDTCDTRKLIEWAEMEGRVLLTRDVKLFRRRLLPASHMHLIRSTDKREQLREVVTAFRLLLCESSLLSRCIRCNGTFKPQALGPAEAAAAAPWTQVVPSHVLDRVAEFWQCCQCQHLFWEGCQFDRAIKQFTEVCQLSAALAQTNVSANS
ncbi:unnamed protein product [Closterium sp. Yama58-4]|nr:unnamed protein product [Closterium sp. Yama58-4]